MSKHINMDDFKTMFSAYCHNEVEAGNCGEHDCAWCCVNQAWERIFHYDRNDEYYDED